MFFIRVSAYDSCGVIESVVSGLSLKTLELLSYNPLGEDIYTRSFFTFSHLSLFAARKSMSLFISTAIA